MQLEGKAYSDLNLAVVCPMANERSTVASFIQEVLTVCRSFGFKSIRFYSILDSVSKDGTKGIVEELSRTTNELRVVFAPENRNVVDAYKRGYREALQNGADWVLEIDAGFSHRPLDISKFFTAMKEGDYACVFASRFCEGGRFIGGGSRRMVSFWGTQLINACLGTKLSDMTSGFELFQADALRAILEIGINSKGPFFQSEIRTHAHRFRIREVPIVYDGGTGHVHQKAIKDAFVNLWALYKAKRIIQK